MEDAPDYEKMAAEIDAIEAASAESRATIDVNAVFANRVEAKKIGYAEVDRVLEGVEAKKAEVAPQAQQPQPQAQAQPLAQAQARAPKREIAREMGEASRRLRDVVGRAGREFEESVAREIEREREKNLVMPRLSLQDQLSDLEKIDEGVGENAFDKEQLRVIRDEVRALSAIAAKEDASRYPEDQRELLLVREQKIKEIKTRLNIR